MRALQRGVRLRLPLRCLQLPHDFVTPRRRCRELCAAQRHLPHFPAGSMRELGAADGAALLAPRRRELPRQTGPGRRTSSFVRPAFIALRYLHVVTRVVVHCAKSVIICHVSVSAPLLRLYAWRNTSQCDTCYSDVVSWPQHAVTRAQLHRQRLWAAPRNAPVFWTSRAASPSRRRQSRCPAGSACRSTSRCSAIRSRSVQPSTYSIAMNARPSCSPMSWIVQMLG